MTSRCFAPATKDFTMVPLPTQGSRVMSPFFVTFWRKRCMGTTGISMGKLQVPSRWCERFFYARDLLGDRKAGNLRDNSCGGKTCDIRSKGVVAHGLEMLVRTKSLSPETDGVLSDTDVMQGNPRMSQNVALVLKINNAFSLQTKKCSSFFLICWTHIQWSKIFFSPFPDSIWLVTELDIRSKFVLIRPGFINFSQAGAILPRFSLGKDIVEAGLFAFFSDVKRGFCN